MEVTEATAVDGVSTLDTEDGKTDGPEQVLQSAVSDKHTDLLHEPMKKSLDILKRYTENRVDGYSDNVERHLTEDVLKAVFDFRNSKGKLNESKLLELGPLVEACIDAIDDCIFFHGNSFEVDCGLKYLVLRSGLQFMIEDFESLQEELYVEFFDERLKDWKNNFGKFWFCEYSTPTAEELRRPEGIPAHHTWWFELYC